MQRTRLINETQDRLQEQLEELATGRSCEFWGQGGSGSGFRGWGVQRTKLISETLERLLELLEELTTGRSSCEFCGKEV